MTRRLTPGQRQRALEMLEEGADRVSIAAALGISPAQVSAIAAHRSMGTYARKDVSSRRPPVKAPKARENVVRMPIARGSAPSSSSTAVLLGTDNDTNDTVFWNPHPENGSSNPHVLIVGETGSGKTYTASCLMAELAHQGIPSIVFDYGQGFAAGQLPEEFAAHVQATEFRLNQDGIAINPLQIFSGDVHGPATVAQRVADTLRRIYPHVGVQQHALIRRGVLEVFEDAGIHRRSPQTWTRPAPGLKELERKLLGLAASVDVGVRRVAASAASHLSSLFLFDTFRSTGVPLAWSDLQQKPHQAWILQLGGMESSTERVTTEFLLWNLIRYFETIGPAGLRCFVVLDEAHKLSFEPDSPVERLLREGRKFGVGVLLASQQPEDFSAVAFSNTATKLIFHISDMRHVVSRQLHARATDQSVSRIHVVLNGLQRGCAYVLTRGVGRVVTIASLEERLRRWRAAPPSHASIS